MEKLAFRVVDLAKALVLADNHFLSAAVGRLEVRTVPSERAFCTDGFALGVNPTLLCSQFKRDRAAPKHDLMHTVLHCVFLHPYVSPSIDPKLWSLACDIAVEQAVAQLRGSRPGNVGLRVSEAVSSVESEIKGPVTAEKIYRALRKGAWENRMAEWSELFSTDDHAPWYAWDSRGRGLAADGEEGDGEEGSEGVASADRVSGDERDLQSKRLSEDSASFAENELKRARSNSSNREAERNEWRRVAKALALSFRAFARNAGEAPGNLVLELEEISRIRVDYADFLRQFAVPGEVLRTSDEEFDYVFYTYGLSLYGNLPLIEPLEYREEKRIREFVIVVDTSGSVRGEVVARFVHDTYEILKSTEAFFEKVHVRIIQCDAAVQSDDTITNLCELEEWNRAVRIHGCGGTDFRPAFEYVDRLVEDGAFENLGGLVYFTDGWGAYPEWMPSYKTAFAFYDEDHCSEAVPPWAIQIVLNEDSFASAR